MLCKQGRIRPRMPSTQGIKKAFSQEILFYKSWMDGWMINSYISKPILLKSFIHMDLLVTDYYHAKPALKT